jgi:hypothetical protein
MPRKDIELDAATVAAAFAIATRLVPAGTTVTPEDFRDPLAKAFALLFAMESECQQRPLRISALDEVRWDFERQVWRLRRDDA